jgi:hypothetical protein
MSHRPYIMPIPLSFMLCMVLEMAGDVGSISSTSTAA